MKNGRYQDPHIKKLIRLLRRCDDYRDSDTPVNNYMAYSLTTEMSRIFGDLREDCYGRVVENKLNGEWDEDQ